MVKMMAPMTRSVILVISNMFMFIIRTHSHELDLEDSLTMGQVLHELSSLCQTQAATLFMDQNYP